MIVTVEMSLYPLQEAYGEKIMHFLEKIQSVTGINMQTNSMSTLITGDYDTIMQMLQEEIRSVFHDQKAVFIIKISNGCLVDE